MADSVLCIECCRSITVGCKTGCSNRKVDPKGKFTLSFHFCGHLPGQGHDSECAIEQIEKAVNLANKRCLDVDASLEKGTVAAVAAAVRVGGSGGGIHGSPMPSIVHGECCDDSPPLPRPPKLMRSDTFVVDVIADVNAASANRRHMKLSRDYTVDAAFYRRFMQNSRHLTGPTIRDGIMTVKIDVSDIDNTDNDVEENAICVGRFFQQFGEDCVREVMARKIQMQQHIRDVAGDHNTEFTHTVFEVSLGFPF